MTELPLHFLKQHKHMLNVPSRFTSLRNKILRTRGLGFHLIQMERFGK